jgi:cholesterol transport system auxiliary component
MICIKNPSRRTRHAVPRAAQYASLVRPFVVALVALGTCGCALTSKADVVEIRHFSPEHVRPRLTSTDAPPDATPRTALVTPAPSAALDVRLGRVTSGPNLRERIVYRNAAYELSYYEGFRWTERPETFVRRALGRALFEEHGLHRVMGGASPTLEVEVLAFDDLRLSTVRAARVQLNVVLFEDRGVIYEETVTVDHPVSARNPKIEDVVAAMSEALDAAADRVTRKVQAALVARRGRAPADR